jgi:hypothetical protein
MVKQLVQIEAQDTWMSKTTVVVQIPSPYVFYSDDSIHIEQFSPELTVKSKMNWRVIPGNFDIYSWQRPLNWAFEWDFSCGDFEIRAGEPQYNLRFLSKEAPYGSYRINLIREDFKDDIKSRLELTKDVAKIRRGTTQLFSKAADLRNNKMLISKND